MKSFDLSFGKVNILHPDMAEIIVHEGVEMNSSMVNEFYKFMTENLTSPFFLLINKVNDYSYDSETQFNFGTLEKINSIAVVANTRAKQLSAENLALVAGVNPKSRNLNLKIFADRDEALRWLMITREK